MKRIMTIMFILLILNPVHAEIEDLTTDGEGTGLDIKNELGILTQLAKMDSKISAVQASADASAKTEQITQMKEEITAELQANNSNFHVQFLITLFIFLVFAWGTGLLAKSKRWI